MCISIPPKFSVSSVVGFIKGKSAISIARNFLGRRRNFTGESFWARECPDLAAQFVDVLPHPVLCQNSALLKDHGCNLMHRKVLASFYQHLTLIAKSSKHENAKSRTGRRQLVLGHPLAATIGDSARCMQNLEKVLFTGPKTSDTVTFICD